MPNKGTAISLIKIDFIYFQVELTLKNELVFEMIQNQKHLRMDKDDM